MSSRWRSALLFVVVLSLVTPSAVSAGGGVPPSCIDDSTSVNEDATANGQLTCTDLDTGNADFQVVKDVSHGSLNLNHSDGSFTYDSTANFYGADSFDFTVTDGDGTSVQKTFDITVDPLNDPPTFTAGPDQSTSENAPLQTVTNWATAISEGPPNESSQTVSFTVTNDNNSLFSTQPAINSAGTLTYRPATSQNGSATVSAQLIDSGPNGAGNDNTSATKTFTIDVGGVNDPPSFTKGADATVNEDSGPHTDSGWATGISPGPSDESTQIVTFVVSNDNTALFSADPAVASNGTLTFTPAPNANGGATVTLHAHDNGTPNANSVPQTFTITVDPLNDPPTFSSGSDQAISENAPLQTVTGWATAITKGPSDESAQTLLFTVTNDNNSLFSTQPAISPTGTLTYRPATSHNGSATVSVQLFDSGPNGGGSDNSSAMKTFTIDVGGVNDPPSFVKGGDVTINEDSGTYTESGWATAISEGPPDESSQTVTFVVTGDTNAALFGTPPAVASNGTLTFSPALNANGSTTITLHAHDDGTPNADSGGQSFVITILPVNDAPTFTKGLNQTVVEDSGAQTVSPWATAILEGPPNEVAAQTVDFVVESPISALFSVQPAVSPIGTLTFTVAPNAAGVASIKIHLHDSGGGTPPNDDTSATATFTITVTGVNDLPTCTNDSAATFVDVPLVNAPLSSCVDLDSDTLSYSLVGGSTHGTAVVHPNGTYTYTPNAGYQGTDAFAFTAADAAGPSNTATMSILVSPDPIARNDVAPTDFPAIIQGSGPTAIPVLANDLDKQGGPLTIQSVTQGAKGKVTITGAGTGLTYDPTGLATGTDSFRYTIVDNQSRMNSAIVVVSIVADTVRPVATVPWMLVIGPSTLGSTTVKVRISWSGSDVGTGIKSYALQESVSGGSFKNVALASPLSRSAVRNVTINKGYRYRVRATDAVGNFSVLAYGLVTTAVRVQETSTPIAYAGHWGVTASTTYSGGTERWTTVTGASATYTFSGLGIAWVAAKGITHGGAQVFIDGVLAGSVSQYASRTAARQVLFATRFAVAGVHTIRIVVSGTAGHPRIDLDTFILTR